MQDKIQQEYAEIYRSKSIKDSKRAENGQNSDNGTGRGYDLISRIESIPGTRFPLG